MDVLLRVDFAVAEKDCLYGCLDRIWKHKRDLFVHLQQRWQSLFDVSFEVLLYDLTSTYVEGEAEQNPKAQRSYSRDGRPDCQQVRSNRPEDTFEKRRCYWGLVKVCKTCGSGRAYVDFQKNWPAGAPEDRALSRPLKSQRTA